MADAEVIIPELVTLVDIKGSTPKQDYAAHITFRGLTFAYSDWNLAEVDGSHGNATVQGCTYMNKFSTGTGTTICTVPMTLPRRPFMRPLPTTSPF